MSASIGSDVQLRELFERAPDGIFIAGPEGRYTDVNPAGCRLLGYSREELIGRSIAELVAPEERAREVALRRHILAGGAEVSEWRLRRKDGTFVPVEQSANGLPGGRLCAFVRDITERHQAEARLRVSEAKYSGIVSMAADAIISVDDQQRITLFNDGAETMFGYTTAEVLGAPLELLIPERLHAIHREHVRAFAAGAIAARRASDRSAIIGRRKNGEEFPADAAISTLKVDGHRLLTVAMRDISEQKLVEDEQRLLAELGTVLVTAGADYERMLTEVAYLVVRDLADWCAVDLVSDGAIRRVKLVHASPAMAAVCVGLERYPIDSGRPILVNEALRSQHTVHVAELPPGHLERVAQDAEHLRLLRELDPHGLIVVPLIARGQALGTLALGASRPSLHFSAREVVVAERLASRLALAVDNARLHEALEQAVRARDEVLAIVAHDLRGPLHAMVLEAELVRRQKPEAAAARAARFADLVTRSVKRMNHLIEDVLDVTRAEASGLPITRRAVVPSALLAEAAEAHEPIAAEAGLELRLELAGELPDVWGDSERLLQTLGNLIGNAVKFTPRGGRITLGATAQGGQVVFRVEDTGPGIPAQQLPHIFDRFWQARTDRRGAGLGLAIAKRIIDAHGGQITVDSSPGHGSTFRFSVPILPRPAREPLAASASPIG